MERGQSELGFDFRLRLEVERKRAIAKAAAAMVDEGEAVALDRARPRTTSALELHQEGARGRHQRPPDRRGAVRRPRIPVLVTGGMLRLQAMSLVGDLGAEALRTTRISKGFLGARGLSLEAGLMDLNPDEVRIKGRWPASASAWSASPTAPSGTDRVAAVRRDRAGGRDRHRHERAGRGGQGLGGARGAIVRVDPVEGGSRAPATAAGRPSSPRRYVVTDAGTPIVELRDASKSYGAVRALLDGTPCPPPRGPRSDRRERRRQVDARQGARRRRAARRQRDAGRR